MRRFLASGWFPLVTACILAAATTTAFAWFAPTGAGLSNDTLIRAVTIAGWVAGAVIGLLSFLLMAILNGIRRLARIRNVAVLHAPVAFLGVLPWMIFAWQLVMHEPRYTQIGIGIIDFVGKPMFLGAFVALVFIVFLFPFSLSGAKRRS